MDLVAGFLDFGDTGELWNAINRGEAPRPTGTRRIPRGREPVWSTEAVIEFIRRRHRMESVAANQSGIETLVPKPQYVVQTSIKG